MVDMIRFSSPSVELKAAAGDDSGKGIRCSIAAYNGGEMNISGYGPVVVDTNGVTAASQVPLLSDHNDSLGGVVGWTQVNATEGKLAASGYIVPETADARQIVALAKSGFSFQASIGLEPTEKEQVPPDTLVNVNGQQIRAGKKGLTLVRAGTLKEISIVPLGADASTSVTLAARKGTESMSTTVQDDAETARISEIKAMFSGKHKNLEARAILDGWTPEKTRTELNRKELKALRDSRLPASPAVGTMHANRADAKDILAAAVLIRAGQEEAGERGYGEHVMQRARDMRFSSLHDILRAAWQMEGKEPPRDVNDMIRASDAATPISLPGILSNSMHKVLLNSYQAFPSAARLIAKKLTAKDFKQHTELRLTGDIIMKPLASGGEIQHAQLGEQKYPWQVDTYARLIKIDRKIIINDDLAAFGSIPQMFGRGAALAQENLIWSLILANTGSFFSGGNGNYLSGVTVGSNDSRLNMEGLANAVATMLKQTDDAGYPVNIVPRYLVVPPELKAAADALYRSTAVITGLTGAAGTPTTIPGSNTFFGLAEPAVSPYLSNASYSGYSTTGWYLFGQAGDVAAFGIGYLNSMEAPVVEQVPNAPENLGWCFRAFSDFGVCQLDHRGAVMSKGAA